MVTWLSSRLIGLAFTGAAATVVLTGAVCGDLIAQMARPDRTFQAEVDRGPVADTGVTTTGLYAGFGRVDITPPPGFGLQGYSLAGDTARGYRTRLYARALVIEDALGERLAFVVADLGQVSLLLHHEVAASVSSRTGIDTDRLMLAATHTHAGPGHYFAASLLNKFGSAVEGYDPQLAELLARGIARAVEDAYRARRPAVAAWGQTLVWGHTRNRSYGAYEKNQPPLFQPAFPPPADRELTPEQKAVDPTWTMLRVDTLASDGSPVPAGALSIFAVHGTGNPTSNDLYDSDIHGLASKRIEVYIDELNNVTASRVQRAVHLFANGTQGDVSANWPPESRCEPLRLVRGHRPGGPRTQPPLDRWYSPTRKVGDACIGVARDYIDSLADSLAAHAIQLYERLGDQLGGDLSIRRAFWTVPLRGENAPEGLCDEPRIGTAFIAGAEDGRSHAYKWKVLGLLPLGIEEGGHAIRQGEHGCHTSKRLGLSYWVQGKFFVKTHGLPRTAQLAALQVGDMLLGVVPGEVTTTAGYRMVEALRERAASAGLDVENTAIIGLANGYLQYLTTPEEYSQQHYEGGSMLYGPQSAVVFTRLLADLVDSLAVGGSAHLDPYPINPGAATAIVDLEAGGPEVRRIEEAYCSGDTAVVRWLDAPPGALIPARGPVLEFGLSQPDGNRLEIWDDDPNLEVRALRRRGDRYLWEARWAPPAGVAGDYSFRLIRATAPGNGVSFSCR